MIQHARRLFLALGLAAFTALGSIATPASAQIPYFQNLLSASQTKYAAIVVDAKSGEVLYAKHEDSPRYPASITKVMTLYLTFEALASGKLHPDDRVTFSPHATAQAPSKLGVRAGDSISVIEAIQAMTTLSANDAAVAMAEKLGGTESRFAALMTLRAQELGMQNTHFANANGLPDTRNLSTARDIAIMSRAVMRDYPQYYHYFGLEGFDFRGRQIVNHNHLLGPGVDGLKTGFTNASGFNIAISGVRDNRRLIVVVMGGPTRVARDQNAEDLLLTGFNVMRRRAMGEKITVAQNLFEPELSGPVVRPPVEQGDGDQDGLKVELASAPPSRAGKVQIVQPRQAKADRDAKAAKARWAVQVGEFHSPTDARHQIAFVEKRFGDHFDGATGATDKQGRRYKAVFTGLSETDAKDACRALKAKRLACMVIDPA
ncbi:D-alanyl-D-alanine carboxypeptidase [Phenylobacterium sp.]|jgi:D-alanyl-D-alanine carboxypeptidase (penicillin-binding protein 5/6)|uniref:D-alanyl-D-alanine carboxypeptidase family protein n=1 Tax=Phenylobacterium sp. TaxID=1871053 RepID=UPI002E343C9D|nr:D-alanyl-D-alanine carboxypeptidase [Phenylobacterium sp.]HEX4711800.1 D-alanyl-D-alanine carboxypeptidase [Phenylobacterium sp.]